MKSLAITIKPPHRYSLCIDTSKYQKYQYRNCDIDAIIDAGPLYLMQQSMRKALYPIQQSMQAALYPMQQSMQAALYPMQQSMRTPAYPMQQLMRDTLYPMQQLMRATLYPMQQSMRGNLMHQTVYLMHQIGIRCIKLVSIQYVLCTYSYRIDATVSSTVLYCYSYCTRIVPQYAIVYTRYIVLRIIRLYHSTSTLVLYQRVLVPGVRSYCTSAEPPDRNAVIAAHVV